MRKVCREKVRLHEVQRKARDWMRSAERLVVAVCVAEARRRLEVLRAEAVRATRRLEHDDLLRAGREGGPGEEVDQKGTPAVAGEIGMDPACVPTPNPCS
jgi:hypothetical protein